MKLFIMFPNCEEVDDQLSLDYSTMMRETPDLFYDCLLSSDYLDSIRNYLSSENENLLHIAFKLNKLRFIPLLLEIGCDINQRNTNNQTPVDIAKSLNFI